MSLYTLISTNMPTLTGVESPTSTGQDEAIRRLAQIHLHRCIWLPATSTHERLRVAYSTTSNFDDDTLPALLFIGPMFGSRYIVLEFDKLARKHGVRVICVDRPGNAGSMPVALAQRMQVWLETVPALLKHLELKHVALVSHSAGTVYLLNTLYHLREILEPKAPYVAMLGPWVSQKHSGMTMLKAAANLPNGMISGWSGIAEFVNTRIAPSVGWSGGILSSVSGFFQGEPESSDYGEANAQDRYGVDEETGKKIEALQSKYAWAEGLEGGNDEARHCLNATGEDLWGIARDYEEYVRLASVKERQRVNENAGAAVKVKVKIRLFFAASDMLIGKGGQEYMERCWTQDGVDDVLDVASLELGGTNHETVLLDHKKGALARVFEEVRGSSLSSVNVGSNFEGRTVNIDGRWAGNVSLTS